MAVQEKITEIRVQEIIYPESDGKPMAENTLQARWIIILYNNLRSLFSGQEVFIAADLFWYPVEGDPNTKVAPDVLVAFGRKDIDRGSYKQWEEDNIPPQVVFEVVSPSNTIVEMLDKLDFYEHHGVSEFIVLDPKRNAFIPYVTVKGKLIRAEKTDNTWQSPLLGIQFRTTEEGLIALHKDGRLMKTFEELEAEKEAIAAEKETEVAAKKAALQEVKRLKARLRELGEDA